MDDLELNTNYVQKQCLHFGPVMAITTNLSEYDSDKLIFWYRLLARINISVNTFKVISQLNLLLVSQTTISNISFSWP